MAVERRANGSLPRFIVSDWRPSSTSPVDAGYYFLFDGTFTVDVYSHLPEYRDTAAKVLPLVRMLAAVNDLLAACKAWDDGFTEGEQFTPEQFRVWVNERRRMAREAIAKAEGGVR